MRLVVIEENPNECELKACPACGLGLEPVEPYEDFSGVSVECSRCFDRREICVRCEAREKEAQ